MFQTTQMEHVFGELMGKWLNICKKIQSEWRFVAGKMIELDAGFSSKQCLTTGGYVEYIIST